MSSMVRRWALVAVAGLAVIAVPGTSLASAHRENASETQHWGTLVFGDIVPCASDEGYFEVTARFNSTEKFADEHREGHATYTGTFVAHPVTVTRFEIVDHGDHVHIVPAEWEPRPGDSYSGRFTVSGTRQTTQRTSMGTMTLHLTGTSTSGEVVRAQAFFHFTMVDGEPRAAIEGERCL